MESNIRGIGKDVLENSEFFIGQIKDNGCNPKIELKIRIVGFSNYK